MRIGPPVERWHIQSIVVSTMALFLIDLLLIGRTLHFALVMLIPNIIIAIGTLFLVMWWHGRK